MSETPKDFIKLVAEVILFLMILIVLFSGDGIVMAGYDYAQYAEPITLQHALARAITVASYSPDKFNIEIETSSKAHILTVKQSVDDGLYYIHVMPSQKSDVKTKYFEAAPFAMVTDCIVQKVDASLGNVPIIYITKELTDTGCEVKIDAGQIVEEEVKI